MFGLPEPAYMPCIDCGVAVGRQERGSHVCDPERRLDFAIVRHRRELAAFDAEFAAYLDTPRGRFDAWYAAERR